MTISQVADHFLSNIKHPPVEIVELAAAAIGGGGDPAAAAIGGGGDPAAAAIGGGGDPAAAAMAGAADSVVAVAAAHAAFAALRRDGDVAAAHATTVLPAPFGSFVVIRPLAEPHVIGRKLSGSSHVLPALFDLVDVKGIGIGYDTSGYVTLSTGH
eukprot:gene45479-41415_t